jgi:hypothetical protein
VHVERTKEEQNARKDDRDDRKVSKGQGDKKKRGHFFSVPSAARR